MEVLQLYLEEDQIGGFFFSPVGRWVWEYMKYQDQRLGKKKHPNLTWANLCICIACNLLGVALQVIYWPTALCENVEITQPNF